MTREAHNDWWFKGTVTVGTNSTLVDIYSGTGSPEGVVTGVVGSIFTRTDGGSGTALYIKESGTGNTGWVAYRATPTVLPVIGPQGEEGDEGYNWPTSPGPQGTPGARGVFGGDSQPYIFDTTFAGPSDPGNGRINTENGDLATSAFVVFDNLNSDGVSVTTWLDRLDDTVGTLRIAKQSDSSIFAVWALQGDIFDGGGYRWMFINSIVSNGTISNGDAVFISWTPGSVKEVNVYQPDPTSFSIPTAGILRQPTELSLELAERGTLVGTGRLAVANNDLDPSVLKYRVSGSTTIMPDEYVTDWDRTELRGTSRRTMNRSARVQLINVTSSPSRLVLAGGRT